MNNFAFFGSDNLGFESLTSLVTCKYVSLKLVVLKCKEKLLSKNPIYLFCKKNNIFFFNYSSKEDWEKIFEIIKKEQISAIFCCSFGAIFPLKIISFVKDTFNIHPSLLPRWKGPSPISYSIRNDRESAVCLIQIAKKVDSGAIINYKKFFIEISDDYLDVFQKVKEIITNNLKNWINLYYQNNCSLISQDDLNQKETFSKIITFSNRKINFKNSTISVYNFIRSFPKEDLPYFTFQKKHFFISKCFFVIEKTNLLPGTIVFSKKELKIYCLDGYINIFQIQKEGSKILDIKSFLNGKLIFKNYDQSE